MKKSVIVVIAVLAALVLVLLACVLIGGGNDSITIPNVYGVDELSAKNILSSNGLIPRVEYVYDDYVEQGNVVETYPTSGTNVDKNSQVILYVSKGASYLEAKDSRITWYNISSEQDEWEFYSPYIIEDTLYIDCYNVTFADSISWSDKYQYGTIIGEACINDTFDKTVPVSAYYERQDWEANESQGFVLQIPLSDLDISKPTTMYIKLYAYVGDQQTYMNVRINFSITW